MKRVPGKLRPYRLRRLKGERPEGHPETDLSRGTKVFPIPNQVWVERPNDQLWVVQHVVDAGVTGEDCLVYLVRYDCRQMKHPHCPPRVLQVKWLHHSMLIWEAATAAKKKFLAIQKKNTSLVIGIGKNFQHSVISRSIWALTRRLGAVSIDAALFYWSSSFIFLIRPALDSNRKSWSPARLMLLMRDERAGKSRVLTTVSFFARMRVSSIYAE